MPKQVLREDLGDPILRQRARCRAAGPAGVITTALSGRVIAAAAALTDAMSERSMITTSKIERPVTCCSSLLARSAWLGFGSRGRSGQSPRAAPVASPVPSRGPC